MDNLAKNEQLANLRIDFYQGTPSELRQVAEQSVATLIKRREEVAAKARAAETEVANLTNALNAPLRNLIASDPEAAAALEQLNTRSIIHAHETGSLLSDPVLAATDNAVGFARVHGQSPLTLAFGPPYNFSWSWHAGGPPFNQMIDPRTGRVGLDARSGSVTGGFAGSVAAHVGFGVFLSTDHPTHRTAGGVVLPSDYVYHLRTVGIASATADGGWECTALENGQLIASSSFQWWGKRISNGENSDGADTNTAGYSVPNNTTGLTFAVQPGRAYTFNVGLWVSSDRSFSAGAAAAQSLGEGNITRIWAS